MKLVYVSPGPIPVKEGAVALPARSDASLRETARLWPGELIVVAPASIEPLKAEDNWLVTNDLPYSVVVGEELESLAQVKPDVVTGLHRVSAEPWVEHGYRCVLTSEFNLPIRLGIHKTVSSSGVGFARAAVGQLKIERRLRSLAKKVAGLQCNGVAAFDSYARLNQNPLLYNDHRITQADLDAVNSSAGVAGFDGSRPLRVAFSGRLTAVKGVMDFVAMARQLQQWDVPVEAHVLGAGDQLETVQRAAPRNTTVHGFVDFDPDWKEFVRSSIDVMVLPHPQGDPSCTYYESLGCGVPVLGYANATWGPFVAQHGAGWALKKRGGESLATTLRTLLADPSVLVTARQQALNYMQGKSFEQVTRARTDHILNSL